VKTPIVASISFEMPWNKMWMKMPIKASISFEMPWNEMRMKDLPKQAFHLKCLEMKCEWKTYQNEHFIWNAPWNEMQMKLLSEQAFCLKQWKCNSNIALHFQNK